jgi:hypothetical protein
MGMTTPAGLPQVQVQKIFPLRVSDPPPFTSPLENTLSETSCRVNKFLTTLSYMYKRHNQQYEGSAVHVHAFPPQLFRRTGCMDGWIKELRFGVRIFQTGGV